MSFAPGFSSGPSGDMPPDAKVPNYLVQSILLTLCCCLPLGIVCIVFAVKTNSLAEAGNMAAAWESAQKTKKWCWIAFGVGLVVNIIYGIIQGISMMAAIGTGMAN